MHKTYVFLNNNQGYKMVDFNSEGVLSTNQEFILQLLILEYFDNVMSAIQNYYDKDKLGIKTETNFISSRLIKLYFYISGSLKEYCDKEKIDFTELRKIIFNETNINKLVDVSEIIKEHFLKSGFLKYDAKREYSAVEGYDEFESV